MWQHSPSLLLAYICEASTCYTEREKANNRGEGREAINAVLAAGGGGLKTIPMVIKMF
jgi:hypothetical protein